MIDNSLSDVWRSLIPGIKGYSWFKPNEEYKSIIDYRSISDHLMSYVSQNIYEEIMKNDEEIMRPGHLMQVCYKMRNIMVMGSEKYSMTV